MELENLREESDVVENVPLLPALTRVQIATPTPPTETEKFITQWLNSAV